MKIVLITITFIVSITTAFLIGANVGSMKVGILEQANDASSAMYEIDYKLMVFDSVEAYESYQDSQRYFKLRESILSYGRYLSSWQSKVPILEKYDDSTDYFFEEAIKFYLETKYEPPTLTPEEAAQQTIENMRAHGELDESAVGWLTEDIIARTTEERESFNRAISNFK